MWKKPYLKPPGVGHLLPHSVHVLATRKCFVTLLKYFVKKRAINM